MWSSDHSAPSRRTRVVWVGGLDGGGKGGARGRGGWKWSSAVAPLRDTFLPPPQHTPSKVLNICYLSSEDCRAEIWLFKNVLLLTLLNIKILCCGHPASQSEKPFTQTYISIHYTEKVIRGIKSGYIYVVEGKITNVRVTWQFVIHSFLPHSDAWLVVVHQWHWGSSINSSRHPHEVSQHRVLNVTQFPDHLYLRAGPLCQRQVGKVRSSAGTHKHSCVRIPCV